MHDVVRDTGQRMHLLRNRDTCRSKRSNDPVRVLSPTAKALAKVAIEQGKPVLLLGRDRSVICGSKADA